MTNLIMLENISLAYGLDVLLDKVKFQISSGERVCLIGRNGAGKSSLMKIIEGSGHADSGTVWRKPNLRFSRLEQELPLDITSTVFEYVSEGLADAGKLLSAYHALTHKLEHSHTQKDLDDLEKLSQKIEAIGAWHFDQEITKILTRLELDPDKKVAELSGGWQRRAALAKALVISPELLLLDEPTNHLDIEAIQWLEDYLLNSNIGLIFITHDRALLQRLATRIIELDRGNLTSWPGDYQNFLARKEEMLHAEDKQNADFDKKLAQEEKWIRQGVKARRTRNEGRVRALEAMRLERSKRREQQGTVNLEIGAAEKSGKLVVEVENLTHQYDGKVIIKNFSTRIIRGDRIGLIGPNGAGKTTLLNLLLGKIPPQEGSVNIGTNLQVAYFDQLRATLNPNKTVAENVTEGSDTIEINGQKRHIISYLEDFLFSPQRARTPVKALSGGECNRLLLARLFSRPSNILVMDEPTNDLDIETLELLESVLADYKGTLLLVSHDRQFLDDVVTSTFVFEGNGNVQEYVGGYQDWIRQRKATAVIEKPKQEVVEKNKSENTKKLSYKEQRELQELPAKIEKMEAEQAELQTAMAAPEFYQQDHVKVQERLNYLEKLTTELQTAYHRWNELEGK